MKEQSDKTEQQRRDAFKLFGRVDRITKMISGPVVVLMGVTRAGKSTCFNLITAPQTMIGRKNGTNNFYQLQKDKINPQIQYADVNSEMASLTSMPNIAKLTIANTPITLMDLAGFGDRRIPLEILTVNYIQVSFLKAIKNIRFTIVFTEKGLEDISDNGLKRTLNEFLNIFNFKEMTKEDKKQFYSSVAFLVTSAKNDLEDIIEQLKVVKENFLKLHDSNPLQIRNFQIVIGLIQNIIENQRIDVAPISKKDKVGEKLSVIQTFWDQQKGWNGFNLQKHGDKLQSAYMEQFYKLKEKQEQDSMKQTIKWRFDQCRRFKFIVCSVMKKIIDNIGIKQYDIQEEIQDLKSNFIERSFYQNVPSFENESSEIITVPLQQRVKLLCKIIDLSAQFKHLAVLKGEQTNEVKSQEEYVRYIQNLFKQELSLLNKLCGTTRQLRIMFKQLQFIFSYMFTEATTLILLDTEQASKLEISICQDSCWADQLYISSQNLKVKFIKALASQEYSLGYFSQLQLQNLIIYFINEEPKLKDLSPIIAFSVGYKFNLLKNNQLENTLKSSSVDRYLQNFLRALFYTLKHVACLNKTNKSSTQEQGLQNALLQTQKDILSSILECIFNYYKNYNIIMEVCNQLRQYSLKCRYYEKIINIMPKNTDLIHNFAKYCREIGKSQKSIELLQKLKKILPKDKHIFEQQIRQIEKQSPKLIQKYRRLNKQQQQTLFDPVKGLKVINTIRKQILKISESIQSDFAALNQRYMQKMKGAFAAEEFRISFPKNPTLYQYIEINHQLIAKTKGKKLTVLISFGSNTGQTTLFYQILGKKLYSSNGRYNLNQHQGESRINNNRDNPTIFPNICPLNDKQELVVDFPLLSNSPPQKILIVTGMFEKMLKQCGQFRLILVVKADQVLKNEGVQFIGLINYLLTIFDIAQISNNAKKNQKNNESVCKSVLFTFTFMTDPLNIEIRNKMKEFKQSLADDQKSIQNQKRYKLVKAQQRKCHFIIENVYYKGSFKNMMIPSKDNSGQSSKKKTLLEDLTTNQNYDIKWHYIKGGQKVRNMGTTTLFKMMESQRNQAVKYMRIKFEKVKQILNLLLYFTYDNYKNCVLDKRKNSNSSLLNNLRVCLQQSQKKKKQTVNEQPIQSTQEEMGQKGEEMKLLRYFRALISLKLISFEDINCPISNSARPSEYFDKLILVMVELFTNVANLCSNQTEEKVIKDVMVLTKSLLVEIQGYSYIMNQTVQQPFDRLKQSNSGVAETMGKVLQIKNLCEAVLQRELPEIRGYFFKMFNPKEFDQQCEKYPEHAESSLLDYQFILRKIYAHSSSEQYNFHLPIIAKSKETNQNLIQLYQSWSKQKQLSLAYIDKILLLYEEEQYVKSHSKRPASINVNHSQLNWEIEGTLIKIAQGICVFNKDHAMYICEQLMSFKTTKEKIYALLIQKEDRLDKKVNYMKQLFQFLNKYQIGFNQKIYQIKQRLTKIKEQMRASNHPDYPALKSWFEQIHLLEKKQYNPRTQLDHQQIKELLNQIKTKMA